MRAIDRKSWVPLALVAGIVAGCATPPPGPVQRLPEEQSRLLGPEAKRPPTPDELVALAAQGVGAKALIERLRQSDARVELKPSQAIDLARRGVPVEVLDYLHDAWARGLQADVAGQLVNRDRQCAAEAERLRREAQAAPVVVPYVDPFWGWPYYGYPGWRGGVYFGR